MIIPGEPVWVELNTPDMEKAEAFYGALFGWLFEDEGLDYGHYNTVRLGDELVAGAMELHPDLTNSPPSFAVYLAASDVPATSARAEAAGARVTVAPMEIPGRCTMAYLQDPTGAHVGLWEGDQVRVEARDKPGGFTWWELMTGDYGAAVAFYGDVFGMDIHPLGAQSEPFQYSTFGQGDGLLAGICDAATIVSDEVPSHWRVYVQVVDVDSSVEKVRSLGGTLLDGPVDSPFGRVATVADDQGAQFQLIDANPL
ncbi:VOC family protein [Tessaracoccus antarcticus]|uniref:VOC family protein n=1 Tax=Tessaracoccus antarcticus TaxID=2479848 RepID=A0A3M0GA94_9ACTN|nr:VOC family protein [Tessaracoccus antarcticus]RMB61925.1 VOC family protein [Tessaracoccus antarcticus]